MADGEDTVIVRAPPPEAAVPVVYDSPHSGRGFPEDFAPAVPIEDLVGYEDRLVDDLVAGAPRLGILLLAAGFPRAYIDPNRAEDDLDREIVGDSWPGALNPTDNSERGIGLVFRTAPGGRPIYDHPLDHGDIAARIETRWRPYHRALEDRLAAIAARWGKVWHVNWHSMHPVGGPRAPDPGATRPDFVVSDRDGASSGPGFAHHVVAALRGLGYSVAVNDPFKGGYIVARHGRPADGRHSLQIEINRRLYLDMETLEAGPGFLPLKRDLDRVGESIADYARAQAG